MGRKFSEENPARAVLRGMNLIEASAGTGKTYTITTLFLRLILEKDLGVDQILVVTYTKAATEELRERIRRRLREALKAFEAGGGGSDEVLSRLLEVRNDRERAISTLRISLAQFDQAPIYTIHGFCQRVLRDNAFESRSLFDTELVTDQDDFLAELAEDFWRRETYPLSELPVRFLREKKMSLAALRALSRERGVLGDVPFVPEPRSVDIEGLEDDYRRWIGRLRGLWERCAGDIREMLCDKKVLDGRRYRKDFVSSWSAKMEDWLFSAAPQPAAPFDAFDRFTTKRLAEFTKPGQAVPSHPFFDACDEADAFFRAFDDWIIHFKAKFLVFAREEQAARKQRQNVQFFDDLLHRVGTALRSSTGETLADAIRGSYPAALIDEFQDTDPVQYDIFRRVYAGGKGILFLIGDPKQAIYGFRGADIHAYLQASSEAGARYTLDVNWRSEPCLVAGVNRIFGGSPPPFVFEDIPYHTVRPAPAEIKEPLFLEEDGRRSAPLRFWFLRRSGGASSTGTPLGKGDVWERIFRSTAAEVARLIREGARGRVRIGERNLEPADVAIIVKAHWQAHRLQEYLGGLNVPSVLYSQDSLMASEEARELERILAAVADPGDERAIKAALLTRILGMTANELLELQANDDRGAWEDRVERFRSYRDTWLSRGFTVMFRHLLAAEGIPARLLAGGGGERRLTNVLHSAEVLQQAAAEHRLGMDGLLKWLQEQRETPGRDEERQLRLESDEDRVKVVTMHRSKGLEYSVVLCPFLWDGRIRGPGGAVPFHDPSAGDRLVLDLGSEARGTHEHEAREEQWRELMRLLYVSLTRAKHRCYVVWGAIKDSATSPLGYVLHRHRLSDEHAGNLEAVGAALATLSDEEMLADLASLALKSEGCIGVEEFPEKAAEPVPQIRDVSTRLQARMFDRRVRRDWRVASYTALASGGGHAGYGGWLDDDRRDREQHEAHDGERPEAAPKDPVFGLPRGASVGSALHGIFEDLDFTLAGTDGVHAVVDRALRNGELDGQWIPTVAAMVEDVLSTRLLDDEPDLTLSRVGLGERLNELEFYFPLGRISPSGLRDVFRKNLGAVPGGDRHGDPYHLDFTPVRGFMKGYVDLVFRWNGKFFLADYKSNHLGDSLEDYRRDRLPEVMSRENYLLQYHVYAVALHRYLRRRIAGYRYDDHFGGVFYFFLRGMRPDRGPGCGIFHDRPSEGLITALDEYFSSGEELR